MQGQAKGNGKHERLPRRLTPQQEELFQLPVKGFREFANVLGGFYQLVAAQVVFGEILTTDSSIPFCPDITFGNTVMENKASSTQRAFRMGVGQIGKYREYGTEKGYRVVVSFMQHSLRGGFKKLQEKTVQATIHAAAEAVRWQVILDHTIIEHCLTLADTPAGYNLGVNVVAYEKSEFMPFLKIPHPVLRRFTEDPEEALEDLELNPRDFVVVKTTGGGIQISGVDVAEFPAIQVIKKQPTVIIPVHVTPGLIGVHPRDRETPF